MLNKLLKRKQRSVSFFYHQIKSCCISTFVMVLLVHTWMFSIQEDHVLCSRVVLRESNHRHKSPAGKAMKEKETWISKNISPEGTGKGKDTQQQQQQEQEKDRKIDETYVDELFSCGLRRQQLFFLWIALVLLLEKFPSFGYKKEEKTFNFISIVLSFSQLFFLNRLCVRHSFTKTWKRDSNSFIRDYREGRGDSKRKYKTRVEREHVIPQTGRHEGLNWRETCVWTES